MKECGLELYGGFAKCCELDNGRCVVLQNESVPGGKLEELPNTLKRESTNSLDMYKRAHSKGGFYFEKCKASPQIVEAVEKEIERRKQI